MADFGSAAQQLGTSPQMLASNSGAFQPPAMGNQQAQKSFVEDVGGDNEQGKFAQWFQSEGTQVMIGGLFDAIGSLGAGMAGISPGGLDRSSVAQGAAHAQGAWDRSQKRWDMKQFGKFIDGKIKEEKAKGKDADEEKLMTLQMLKRNPEAGIKAQMDRDNWKEKADYGHALWGAKVDAQYGQALGVAVSAYDKLVSDEMKSDLLNGKPEAFRNLMMMPGMTDHVLYLISEGGPLHAVRMSAEKKKDGSVWDAIKGLLGFGGDDGESSGGMSVGDGDYAKKDVEGGQSVGVFGQPGATYPAGASGTLMKGADAVLQSPISLVKATAQGRAKAQTSQMMREIELYGSPVFGRDY